MTRDEATVALIRWLRAVIGGSPSEVDRVIRADDKRPRPALPYLTVRIVAFDIAIGEDEPIESVEAGNAVVEVRGQREGVASVQGFGDGADVFLSRAVLALSLPSGRLPLEEASLAVRVRGGQQNIGRFLDTAHEPRFLQEFRFGYAVGSNAETVVALEEVVLSSLRLDRGKTDPDPLVETNLSIEVP